MPNYIFVGKSCISRIYILFPCRLDRETNLEFFYKVKMTRKNSNSLNAKQFLLEEVGEKFFNFQPTCLFRRLGEFMIEI